METNNYTAINIGPIIKTLGMARKPRELWAASYLFSYLMRCIYEEVDMIRKEIVSPAKPKAERNKIGIYPDRIFIKGDFEVCVLLKSAKKKFCQKTGIQENRFEQYFNLMSVSDNASSESEAIRKLNQQLDVLELCDYAADYDAANAVRYLITKTHHSPLFELETGNKDEFPFDINTLAEIATARLRSIGEAKWNEIKTAARKIEKDAEKKRAKEQNLDDNEGIDASIDMDEDFFYKRLAEEDVFKGLLKSHHKYFCVVQADGDNVGKTVSHPDLRDGQVKKISEALVEFGLNATGLIKDFGGLPLYAGGDDLLFIAPVVGKEGTNVFDLMTQIENEAFKGVVNAVSTCGDKEAGIFTNGIKIEASLSFGVSISYYKYPLYEALESARHLLFDVAKDKKKFPDKKAIAWSFRKHSGGTFDAAFSIKDANFAKQFGNLINVTTDNDLVSALAHKLRQEETLVDIVLESGQQDRLDALFDKVLEFDKDKAGYFDAVKGIMPILYKVIGKDNYIQTLYSLLRTAKFIKGEDLHDE